MSVEWRDEKFSTKDGGWNEVFKCERGSRGRVELHKKIIVIDKGF